MNDTLVLENLVQALPPLKSVHAHTTSPYKLLEIVARQAVEKAFNDSSSQKKIFGPFGPIAFPYFKMGAIDSLDLFGLDELILFSFYWINRGRYKKVLDIGANIGLHTFVFSKCGFDVQLFEPDPIHFKKLQEVIALNELHNVTPHCAAVSNRSGEAEFVRVLGNTTSSHLAGSKVPYGETERFTVKLLDIQSLISQADLIKMDVEGHEGEIICSTCGKDWETTDALIEVSNAEKAEQIWTHLQKIGVKAFAQKLGWEEVKSFEDMPLSYKEGSLFITTKTSMPWY